MTKQFLLNTSQTILSFLHQIPSNLSPNEIINHQNLFYKKLLEQLICPIIGDAQSTSHITPRLFQLMLLWLMRWTKIVKKNISDTKIFNYSEFSLNKSNLNQPPILPSKNSYPFLFGNLNPQNVNINRDNSLKENSLITLPTYHISYPNKRLYNTYFVYTVSGFWQFLFSVFFIPKIKIELNKDEINILNASDDISCYFRLNQDESFISIPLEMFEKKELIILFTINQLSNQIFHNVEFNNNTTIPTENNFKFKECRINNFLGFNGDKIIKHYLLLMIPGLMTFNYHQIFFVYDVIREIISSTPIIKSTFSISRPIDHKDSTNYEDKWIPEDIKTSIENSYQLTFDWIVHLYVELLSIEHIIWDRPESLLQCILKYCLCKPELNGNNCCSICHQYCGKWFQADIGSTNNIKAEGPELFFGYSRHTLPNVLLPWTQPKNTILLEHKCCDH